MCALLINILMKFPLVLALHWTIQGGIVGVADGDTVTEQTV